MQLIQIFDVKDFMSHLLTGDVFDTFLVTEATVTTFVTTHIDGALHPEYFDTPQAFSDTPSSSPACATWRQLKGAVLALIKGHRSPLNMQIVLRLADYNVEKLLRQSGLSFSLADVAGLYLNIYFDRGRLTCTAGSSLRVFTADRSLERTWEEMVEKLFRTKQIPFTIL